VTGRTYRPIKSCAIILKAYLLEQVEEETKAELVVLAPFNTVIGLLLLLVVDAKCRVT